MTPTRSPGEEEFLEPMGMTQAAFAERIGWTRARLNALIRGKRGITAEAALDLAEVLGISPKLWMNVQATYDLAAEEVDDIFGAGGPSEAP